MGLITPELIVKEMLASNVRWLTRNREISMKQDSIEYRIRRKSELNDFMGASIDDLVEEEARQARARIAAEVIGSFVARCRVSAGDLGEMAIQARAREIRSRD